MSDRYLIPDTPLYRVEDIIKKSQFIVSLAHVCNADEAKAFVDAIKEEFPDASHNCWAYQAGAPGTTAVVGMSDDGEPHGTAGKPMLNVLLHADVGEVAAVVTRYFGGTKLGTGGLVRAYSGMVKLGLETLPTREKITPVRFEVVIDYSHVTVFKRMLPEYEIRVLEENFGADASFMVEMPKEHAETFTAAVVELTNGAALIEEIDM